MKYSDLPPVSMKITAEEFLSWPEDGKQYELIDGDAYMTPSPFEIHQRLVLNLAVEFLNSLDTNPTGRVYVAPFDVELNASNVFQPDIIVVLNEHGDRITESHVVGAPDMVVEILSPSTASRDKNIKFVAYAKSGVREVWIVEPNAQQFELYRLREDGQYGHAETVGYDGQLTTPLLPGLSISVSRLYR